MLKWPTWPVSTAVQSSVFNCLDLNCESRAKSQKVNTYERKLHAQQMEGIYNGGKLRKI